MPRLLQPGLALALCGACAEPPTMIERVSVHVSAPTFATPEGIPIVLEQLVLGVHPVELAGPEGVDAEVPFGVVDLLAGEPTSTCRVEPSAAVAASAVQRVVVPVYQVWMEGSVDTVSFDLALDMEVEIQGPAQIEPATRASLDLHLTLPLQLFDSIAWPSASPESIQQAIQQQLPAVTLELGSL